MQGRDAAAPVPTCPKLVAARMDVTTLPGLALRTHRASGIHTTELPENPRQIDAVTYGDPPATTALIHAIQASV